MNDWTDVGSYAYNKMLREREADEALLRQALAALEKGETALRFAAIDALKERLK